MSSIKDIYIIGSGGFGRETVETIRDINKLKSTFRVVGYIDDDQDKWGKVYNDIKVLGGTKLLRDICKKEKPCCVIAIANGDVKEKISKEFDGQVEWGNIIHPTVIISEYANIGVGNVFQPFVIIGPNTQIGDHILVNFKSNVSHDAIIGDYSSIMCLCDITGHVQIKEKVFVASRVSVIPGLVVGESAKLGAGAVIFKDVKPNVTMHGYMAVEARTKK